MAPAGEPWDLWPAGVEPDVVDATVGISRTDVPADAEVGCHEIEQLHLDLIAAARDSIYIENQYLTSATMADALCRRLEAEDGPEIVLVLPLDNAGWLEANTIEALRIRSVRRLRASDRFRRLRLCYPAVPGDGEHCVGLHSKVLVVDDRLFRVGSSNLTNRSMRLDTELDATIEAATPEHRAAVLRLRNRLLAEHLGMPLADVEAFLSADRSLVRLVDARRAESRCLCELPQETVEPILSRELVDPDSPLDTEDLIEGLATSAVGAPARRVLPVVLALVATAALVAFAIRRLRARSLRRSR
jgi:phosphatidylserine/phosphatidylglycerophosphate/cardiolipin synthase-like enzyme